MQTKISEIQTKKNNRRLFKRKVEKANAQSKSLAKRWHEQGFVYVLYGVWDALSLCYSLTKFLFDLFFFSSDNDVSSDIPMHNSLSTPVGMAASATVATAFVTASVIQNSYKEKGKKDKVSRFKRFVAWIWPYFRDVTKGLRNTFKGVRVVFIVVGSLITKNLRVLIVPFSLALGGLLALIRVQQRRMKEERKTMVEENEKLLRRLQSAQDLNEIKLLLRARQHQGEANGRRRRKALLMAAYSGLVDGFYLYIGILGLCPLAPGILMGLAISSGIYLLISIITRVAEESAFQDDLDIQKAQFELIECAKQLEELWLTWGNHPLLDRAMKEFERKREALRAVSTLLYMSAFLQGMKVGLASYGAIAAAMFGIATFMALASITFSPALLVGAVASGSVCIIGFVVSSLLRAKEYVDTQSLETAAFNKKWLQFKQEKKANRLDNQQVNEVIKAGVAIAPSKPNFFMEWIEVGRSFFSGLGKGSKILDFTLASAQDVDGNGVPHDSLAMLIAMPFIALFDAGVLACRAFARMGRTPLRTNAALRVALLTDNKEDSLVTPLGHQVAQPSSRVKLSSNTPNKAPLIHVSAKPAARFSYSDTRVNLFPSSLTGLDSSPKKANKHRAPTRRLALA